MSLLIMCLLVLSLAAAAAPMDDRREKMGDVRENMKEHRENVMDKRDAYEQSREEFREARQDFNADRADDALYIEKAKEFLLKTAERMEAHLENLDERVDNEDMSSAIDDVLVDISSAKETIEAIEGRSDFRAASTELRDVHKSFKTLNKAASGVVVATKTLNLIDRFEDKIADLEIDTVEASEHLATARNLTEEAIDMFTVDAADKDLREGKELLKDARNEIREAHKSLKDQRREMHDSDNMDDDSDEVESEEDEEEMEDESDDMDDSENETESDDDMNETDEVDEE